MTTAVYTYAHLQSLLCCCLCLCVCVTQGMSPALALSILNPKLVFSEGEASAGVQAGVLVTRGDGRQLSPYDLKRLQVRLLSQEWG